jgi:hypothetical protein
MISKQNHVLSIRMLIYSNAYMSLVCILNIQNGSVSVWGFKSHKMYGVQQNSGLYQVYTMQMYVIAHPTLRRQEYFQSVAKAVI